MKNLLAITLVFILSLFVVEESGAKVKESALHCREEVGPNFDSIIEAENNKFFQIIPDFKPDLSSKPWINNESNSTILGNNALRGISFNVSENGQVYSSSSIYSLEESDDGRFYYAYTYYDFPGNLGTMYARMSVYIVIDRVTLDLSYRNEFSIDQKNLVCKIVPVDRLDVYIETHERKIAILIENKHMEEEKRRQEELKKNKI